MRSTYFFGLFVLGSVAAVAAGCGDDDDDGGSGGAGGAPSASSTTSSSTGSSTSSSGATSTTSTSSGGDNDNDCASATEFQLDTQLDAELATIDDDVDFFKFTGVAGQKVLIQVEAKPQNSPEDPAYIDSVVTLYGPDQQQLGQNDDPRPRFSQDSQLFTVLPADGTYCVRVTECDTVFPGQCGKMQEPVDGRYKLYVGDINAQLLVNETPGAATEITYPQTGNIGAKLLTGGFTTEGEVDVYTFTMPNVMPDPGDRPAFALSFFPAGPEWSGATASIQRAAIKDSADAVVAEINPALSGLTPDTEIDINAPLTPGETYTIELAHTSGALGNNPFYYVFNFADLGSNPVETEDNDTTPEALASVQSDDGALLYFVEGNLDVAEEDVDLFSFEIPTGMNRVSATCGAWTSGSGLRDLTLSLLTSAGAPITSGEATEEQTASASAQVAAPTGGSATLKVSATNQDATVTGNYYRCGVSVFAQQ